MTKKTDNTHLCKGNSHLCHAITTCTLVCHIWPEILVGLIAAGETELGKKKSKCYFSKKIIASQYASQYACVYTL